MKPIDTLVIACGNALRGDDSVALVAAERVIGWRRPGVRVVIVHQLLPELIEEMKGAERLLFMDASVDADCEGFRFRPLEPKKSRRLFGHHESPENLLALLQDLECLVPPAWLLSIRALSLDHGNGLTEDAQRHMDQALAWLHEFLADQTCTKSA